MGAGLLFLAVRQWRSRPRPGEPAKLPHWMGAIDRMTVGRGLLLGFLLAAVNPKNLLLGAAAGVSIGASGRGPGSSFVVTIVFLAIAAASVAVPVLAYLIAASLMAGPLRGLRGWLEQNNGTVMSVLLLVIGVVVIGKGLGNF
ncbi:hypothetical protein E3O23_10910 [Cryobacterium tagatosivorans]|uniref:GAP family protein n=2 Tax=Cryobacterium tagatosivorans TaxID=1259199 RepID=A0A4V3I6E4_9MICO|nr:hypothetical protein E3O23_10910 [Cryobacterium tagatosivorans]